jgi:lipopolysaccharide export system protein LptA
VLAATAVGTITVNYNAATETLTLTGSDTLAHYQQVLDTVTFNNGSTNPTNFGSNPTRTVVWTLNDGSASNSSSTPVTETISLTGINAPPTLSNVATSANYTEEGAAATLSGSVSVSDPDDTKLSSATVKITGGTFAGDADLLAASTTGTSITASYNTSTETLTLSGTDTLAHYQQVLDSVTFAAGENPNDFGSNPTRTVTWTLMDPSGTAIGGSNVSTPVTSTISITNVNDPPTLSNVAANVRFLPHHTVTLSPALGVSDPDNLTLSNATVSVTGGTFAGDGDVLAATVTGTSITASYNSSTETLTLTGSDSLAHYQQVLDSVAFSSGNNPSNGANNRTRTVSWVVNDGSASSNLSAPATTTITIGGPPVYDFNGDGDSDLLFQQTSGTPQIWLMNGTSIISETSLATPPASWKIVTSGDFNGDGLSDILWINTSTNQPAIWEMNGTSIISAVGLAAPPSSWHIAGVGDVNGDGHSDIIWQNSDGTPSVWQMNGTSIVSATALPNPGSAWKIVATGDFNGDGNTDLLWDNTASGQPAIWEMNGSSIVSAVGLAPQPANMEIIGTGDFNGDGDADILWLNTITNAPTIWIMNGTSVTSMATLSAPPPSWRLVGTSDLYGTGKADILWQNSDGTTSVWQMNGTSIVSAIAVGTPSNPGGGWQLNNNDPPLPSAADTTTAANGGNGTTRLSMPDAANAGGGIPSYVAGAAGAGAGPTPALFSSNTTVANSLHVGSG